MKCFEIDHLGRVTEKIVVVMMSKPHVRLAWILGEGKTVPIDDAGAKRIEWDPTFGHGYDSKSGYHRRDVLKEQKYWLGVAGVSDDGSALTTPRPDEGDGIIVCWRLISDWGGDVSLIVSSGVEEIARDSRRLSKAVTDRTKLDILAILRPASSISTSITGETMDGQLSYAGNGVGPVVRLDKR
jgi:hypothetical protein